MGGTSGSQRSSWRASPAPRARLSFRVTLSVVVFSLIPTLLASALTFQQTREAATAALEQQGIAVATSFNYSLEALLEQGASHTVQRVVANSAMITDVRKVTLVDLALHVIASSRRSEVGTLSASPLLRRFLAEGGARPLAGFTANDGELTMVRPLYRGQLGGDAAQDVVGAMEITMDQRGAASLARTAALRTLGFGAVASLALAAALIAVLRALVMRPLGQLAATARAFRGGDRSKRSGIRRDDEIGRLAESLDALADDAEATLVQLEEQIAARATLPPLVRVHPGIVVMPLLGWVDPRRTELIEVALIAAIESHGAQIVILDCTGIPAMRDDVAASLLETKSTAERLGVCVIAAGMALEVAARLRAAFPDAPGAPGVPPCPDAESALRAALQLLELEITPRAAARG